ncbi:PIG-L deacetylase family protein [Brevibacillus sp. B_LB10_24]|uniref:PIG-L deacetylase family protein n=1 Tax=Brevibacillus sp. B_LB10_24 TaxID=3380645 RepID=UPI0038B9565B
MGKKLLFVFAHPDDESFASAGTMAKYRAQGHEVFLICATSGCRGRTGGFELSSREELANHREQELRAACDILGVTRIFFYRYPDGSLKEQDRGQMAQRIAGTISEAEPDAVITFPPDGVTRHPDHIAVSKATEQAVILAEETSGINPALYYVSIPHYYDYCRDSGPEEPFPITGKVDIASYRQYKGRALQAHKSQVYSVDRAYPGVMEGDFGVIGNYEYYSLVRSGGRQIGCRKKPPEAIPIIELI